MNRTANEIINYENSRFGKQFIPDKDNDDVIIQVQGISLDKKYSLTITQAAAVFGIGQTKLRRMIDENPYSEWLFRNGNRVMIKREMFAKWLDKQSVI